MDKFTQAVWDVINEAIVDDEALLADLKKILLKEYAPFLSTEQSVPVNTHALQAYFQEKLNQWCEWLPNTTINGIGSELALEAFQEVNWPCIASDLRKHLASISEEKR